MSKGGLLPAPDIDRPNRRSVLRRDQVESPFSPILENILRVTPLSLGAALVDYEGETVDYAGYVDPFELKVAAAHLQLLVTEIDALPFFAPMVEVRIRSKERALFVRVVDPNYSFIMVLHRASVFALSRRAIDETCHLLATEAGLDAIPACQWFEVEVETPRRDSGVQTRRPLRVRGARRSIQAPAPSLTTTGPWRQGFAITDGSWRDAVVIGGMVGLGFRERGYRVALDSGLELNIVRERGGLWFANERL